MAITTLDLALAGMKPPGYFSKAVTGTLVAARPFSPFYLAGVPGAATAPSPGLAGAALTSYAGQLAIPAASGNTHLARFSGVASAQAGLLLLCDRLWHNSGFTITSTGAQTVNSAAVSYTHLRAHETPEHLVCRLLLEKKKKNTKKLQSRRSA